MLFTDSAEGKYIEELGGMNLMLVTKDGRLLTPALGDSILDGVTRRSLLDLAPQLGLEPEERRLPSTNGAKVLPTATSSRPSPAAPRAVVTPIGRVVSDDFTIDHGDQPGEKTMEFRKTLLDIQYGRVEDKNNWMVRLA